MVASWYMDSSDADQRLPHQQEPNLPASLDDLARIGVLYFDLGTDNYLEKVNDLAAKRSYKNRDEVRTCCALRLLSSAVLNTLAQIQVSKEKMGDIYEAKINTFFE